MPTTQSASTLAVEVVLEPWVTDTSVTASATVAVAMPSVVADEKSSESDLAPCAEVERHTQAARELRALLMAFVASFTAVAEADDTTEEATLQV